MTHEAESERLAEGIIRLWGELQRRKTSTGEELSTAELTTPQAIALRAVAREGPWRMGALAEALGVTVATASRTVDALAARKFVRREPDPADARAVRVVATATGKREHWSGASVSSPRSTGSQTIFQTTSGDSWWSRSRRSGACSRGRTLVSDGQRAEAGVPVEDVDSLAPLEGVYEHVCQRGRAVS